MKISGASTFRLLCNDAHYSLANMEGIDRFGGLFMEPAHFTQSAMIYLCFLIFDNNKGLNNKYKIILIIVGIVFSGSGQGYLFLAILLFLWLFKYLFLGKKTRGGIITLVTVGVVVISSIPLLYQFSFFQNALSRVANNNFGFGGKALAGRTYTNYIFGELDVQKRFIGVGFGHADDLTIGYVNSLYRHLFECGYISIPFLVLLIIVPSFKGDYAVISYCLIFWIMIYFTGVWAPMTLFHSLLFIYLTPTNKKEFLIDEKRYRDFKEYRN